MRHDRTREAVVQALRRTGAMVIPCAADHGSDLFVVYKG